MFCIVTVVHEKRSLKSTDIINATSFFDMKTVSCHKACRSKCGSSEIVGLIGGIYGIRGHRCACVCIGVAVRIFFEVNSHITMSAACDLHI
jgi:hypothetical protein